MSRRILTFLAVAAVALTVAGCSAQPSAEASPSATASATRSAAPSPSASGSASPGASAAPTDTSAPEDDGDLGDGTPDPVAPELPATDPGPAVGADGTVQSYDAAAVASVCVPQVQSAFAEATVAPDPTSSWRIDAANVAVEWALTAPDLSLAVVCVITGPFDAPEFVYVTLADQ